VCGSPSTPKGEFQPNGWTWISYLESQVLNAALSRRVGAFLAFERLLRLNTMISVFKRRQQCQINTITSTLSNFYAYYPSSGRIRPLTTLHPRQHSNFWIAPRICNTFGMHNISRGLCRIYLVSIVVLIFSRGRAELGGATTLGSPVISNIIRWA
jgi:hypothetical protein